MQQKLKHLMQKLMSYIKKHNLNNQHFQNVLMLLRNLLNYQLHQKEH